MSEQRVLGEVIVGIGTEFVRLGGFERVCTFIGQLVGGRGRGFAQVAVEHHGIGRDEEHAFVDAGQIEASLSDADFHQATNGLRILLSDS